MKIKNYLFKSTVGIAAFAFGFGLVSIWQNVQSSFNKPETIKVETNLKMAKPELTTFKLTTEKNLSPPPIVKKTVEEPQIPVLSKKAKFDPEGFYFIPQDDLSKEFKRFRYFQITNKDYSDENNFGKLIPPEGSVYILDEKREEGIDYKFTKISIGSGQIQFQTEKVKGNSYEFTGKYLTDKNLLEADEEFYNNTANDGKVHKVLEGTLVKKRKGKKVAEIKVKFGWYLEASCGC